MLPVYCCEDVVLTMRRDLQLLTILNSVRVKRIMWLNSFPSDLGGMRHSISGRVREDLVLFWFGTKRKYQRKRLFLLWVIIYGASTVWFCDWTESKWQPPLPSLHPDWEKMEFLNFPNNECLKQAQPVALKRLPCSLYGTRDFKH